MRNLNKVKMMIRKCYNINYSIPKGYGTRSSNYQHWYNQKNILLSKIVDSIKQFQLPIKYGKKNDVVYFAFDDQQFSFHVVGLNKEIKPYDGNWIGTRRNSFVLKNNKPIGEKYLYNN